MSYTHENRSSAYKWQQIQHYVYICFHVCAFRRGHTVRIFIATLIYCKVFYIYLRLLFCLIKMCWPPWCCVDVDILHRSNMLRVQIDVDPITKLLVWWWRQNIPAWAIKTMCGDALAYWNQSFCLLIDISSSADTANLTRLMVETEYSGFGDQNHVCRCHGSWSCRCPGSWSRPLGPSDAIWQQRSWSTLAQVMACSLGAPSHYLNQCRLTISSIHLKAISQKNTSTIRLEITHLYISTSQGPVS